MAPRLHGVDEASLNCQTNNNPMSSACQCPPMPKYCDHGLLCCMATFMRKTLLAAAAAAAPHLHRPPQYPRCPACRMLQYLLRTQGCSCPCRRPRCWWCRWCRASSHQQQNLGGYRMLGGDAVEGNSSNSSRESRGILRYWWVHVHQTCPEAAGVYTMRMWLSRQYLQQLVVTP
jgi:hypothetical protein